MAAYTENETEIVVHLADGEELRADLLIGADGVYSRVRARLVPGSDAAVHAGHYAWRAMVPAGNERPEGTVLTVGRDGTRGGYARVAEGTTMWMINQFEAGPLTGGKRRAAHDWFTRELDARGGFLLVTTRFIPVGRYLATLSTGLVRYPLGKYLLFIAFATATWSAYTALTGYFGGVGFQENTPLAIAVGVGLAFVVTGVIEGVRRIRRGRPTYRKQPTISNRKTGREYECIDTPRRP